MFDENMSKCLFCLFMVQVMNNNGINEFSAIAPLLASVNIGEIGCNLCHLYTIRSIGERLEGISDAYVFLWLYWTCMIRSWVGNLEILTSD